MLTSLVSLQEGNVKKMLILSNFNEISRKDVAYDNIKFYKKKQGFTLYLGKKQKSNFFPSSKLFLPSYYHLHYEIRIQYFSKII